MQRTLIAVFVSVVILGLAAGLPAQNMGKEAPKVPLSKETQACLECHKVLHPGIVHDWETSRMARNTPDAEMKEPELERRMSATSVPQNLRNVAVGCYECHSLNPTQHKDNFEHAGYQINIVVSPNDCKVCHPLEVEQYGHGKKAHAVDNLVKNPVFMALVNTVDGLKALKDKKIITEKPSRLTLNGTCFACHGTEVTVSGVRKVSSDLGDFELPNLMNWPNQGVGRVNPDGSTGACTACHTRHAFSISIARKPYTCGQCHLEPDIPAYNVYQESKHGNIFFSKQQDYNLENVPWAVGKDFRSPTCATCHNSLLTSPDGTVIAKRNHDFGARPWVRLFGLIYSHAQPKDGRTYLIKNKDGLPLPTTFTGEPASTFLIDAGEQEKRFAEMKRICQSCHASGVVTGHFAKFDNSVREADAMVKTTTLLLVDAWNAKLADKTNPFDESIEQKWITQWLFYANSLRFASAMMGYDHATFHYGWWNLTANLQDMAEMIKMKKGAKR